MSATYIPCLSRDMCLVNELGIRRKSTWQVYFQINYLLEDGETREPLNLTGYTGRCQIRTSAGSQEIIASPHVTIPDPESGLVLLSMTDEETGMIPAPGERWWKSTLYQYDVVLENEDGEAYRCLEGSVEVSPSVTDPTAMEVR